MASQKGFKVVHLNIRSLINKYEQLKVELESADIDVFSISETWLAEGVSSNILNINGYDFERHDRMIREIDTGLWKRGGGLGIYYSKQLACDNKRWEEYNVSNYDLELQVVEFIRKKTRNVLFLNVYRLPQGNVTNMINHINQVLSGIPGLNRKDVIVMGDFNVNMLDEGVDKRKLIRFGQVNNLEQLISKPTRCTATTANIIDLAFCNVTHVASTGVLDLFLSDHMPIFLIKKMDTSKSKVYKTFTGRTYKNYTTEILHEKINRTIELDKLLQMENPIECWESLHDSLVSIADEVIPKKRYMIKAEKPAWLTDELLNLKK